jgi:methylated-DNA-[protein]-cysteine S-methyltransferase
MKSKPNLKQIEGIKENQVLTQTIKQLDEYFKGTLKDFGLSLHLEGTDFQIKVWQELAKIPYGETITYRELANKIGSPKAVRAVGNANNKNPIPIIVPCHRVIGSNGKLVGYAGGIKRKDQLLGFESVNSQK